MGGRRAVVQYIVQLSIQRRIPHAFFNSYDSRSINLSASLSGLRSYLGGSSKWFLVLYCTRSELCKGIKDSSPACVHHPLTIIDYAHAHGSKSARFCRLKGGLLFSGSFSYRVRVPVRCTHVCLSFFGTFFPIIYWGCVVFGCGTWVISPGYGCGCGCGCAFGLLAKPYPISL